MNVLRGGCIGLLGLGLSLSLACQGLARKYSCEQLRAVRPGMLEDEVLRLLGQPVSRSDKEMRPGSWDPVRGVVWSYHVAKEGRPFLRRDLLEVGFVDGRVVLVHASRTNLPTMSGSESTILLRWHAEPNETPFTVESNIEAMFPCGVGRKKPSD